MVPRMITAPRAEIMTNSTYSPDPRNTLVAAPRPKISRRSESLAFTHLNAGAPSVPNSTPTRNARCPEKSPYRSEIENQSQFASDARCGSSRGRDTPSLPSPLSTLTASRKGDRSRNSSLRVLNTLEYDSCTLQTQRKSLETHGAFLPCWPLFVAGYCPRYGPATLTRAAEPLPSDCRPAHGARCAGRPSDLPKGLPSAEVRVSRCEGRSHHLEARRPTTSRRRSSCFRR